MKDELRQECLRKRAALPKAYRKQASSNLVKNVDWFVSFFGGADQVVIGGFLPIRSEFDPEPLLIRLRDRGFEIALPAVIGPDQPLEFRQWRVDTNMEPGAFNTQHPDAKSPVLLPDMLLMPMAAFDLQGGRIGYGGGFYDRTIAAYQHRPHLVGLAFQCQQVEDAPMESHDQRLDYILTENGFIEV